MKTDGTLLNYKQYAAFGETTLDTLGVTRQGYIGKEKDVENNFGDHGVRKYDYETGRFNSIDPLWEKYYGWTPYHYTRNNPILRIDYDGKSDYRNQKGEMLLKTDDGSTDITIIYDKAVKDFTNISNLLIKNGIVNDKESNNEKLKSLGVSSTEYNKQHKTGNDTFDNAFNVGYDQGYNKKNNGWVNFLYQWALLFFSEMPDGAQIRLGFDMGKKRGKSDKSKGHMDVTKDVHNQFKDNQPIIENK